MNLATRLARHLRLTGQTYVPPATPPLLVLFINSVCNMRCQHCFYWTSLNKRDDLSRDELFALSDSLGRIENLNLSGGEPFLRKDFAAVCLRFIRNNSVRQLYVPTNGYFTRRTVDALRGVLEEPALELCTVEVSLDGMPEYHDALRGTRHAFRNAIETCDALAALQLEDRRLRVHAVSTANRGNMDEIRGLTSYLYERCPSMDHHNLAVIRGDRRNPLLTGPDLARYRALYDHIRRVWDAREAHRYGGIVEPMLQWAKLRTIETDRQFVRCRAGTLSGVVYANGDVALCETLPPVGNLRHRSFTDIWHSAEAARQRERVAAGACHCTAEVFLWSSIVYRPGALARALIGSGEWRRTLPL